MKKSIKPAQLKNLIKKVIQEISVPKKKLKSPLDNPLYLDSDIAKERLNAYIDHIRKNTKLFFKAIFENNSSDFGESRKCIQQGFNALENVFESWCSKANDVNLFHEMSNHITEYHALLGVMLGAIKEKNYIVLKQDLAKMTDLFKNMEQTIEKLFAGEK